MGYGGETDEAAAARWYAVAGAPAALVSVLDEVDLSDT
jgi:hypothetical protein